MGAPPATDADHNWVESLSVARKYSVLPSGENVGLLAFNFRSVTRRGCASFWPRSSSQTLLTPLLASQSVLRTVNATSLPLGERCGSETRSIIARSCALKGCCAAMAAPGVTASANAQATRRRFIVAPPDGHGSCTTLTRPRAALKRARQVAPDSHR